jgi:hypothetical protein
MTELAPDLELIPGRRLVETSIDVRFALAAGDRVLATAGEPAVVGTALAERYLDTRLAETGPAELDDAAPGGRWTRPAESVRRTVRPARPTRTARIARTATEGELLFEWRGGWRIAAGDHPDALDAPVPGLIRDVRPGIGIAIRTTGRAIRGIRVIGGPTRGRLELARGPAGELRPGALDVGSAGAILVVGARVDAETLTRARAMGVAGIVVAGLPGKDQRDYLASEARQRAALHRLPPFAVFVLDGALRRPIAGPILRLFEALEGRDVAIVAEPPALVFDEPDIEVELPPADLVRVRSGPEAGREGRWVEAVGLRRFAGGIHLEAARVQFAEGPAIVPVGDLERFV